MFISVIIVYILVVIFPCFISSIVWWVNVNYVNRFFVGITQNRKRMKIIAFNQNVCRLFRIGCYRVFGDFFQYRQAVLRGEFKFLPRALFIPYQPVFFALFQFFDVLDKVFFRPVFEVFLCHEWVSAPKL